jgi:hypothetical protein
VLRGREERQPRDSPRRKYRSCFTAGLKTSRKKENLFIYTAICGS